MILPREGFTGAHVDNVYMGRGTSELLTMCVFFYQNEDKESSLSQILNSKVDTLWRRFLGYGLLGRGGGKPYGSPIQTAPGL